MTSPFPTASPTPARAPSRLGAARPDAGFTMIEVLMVVAILGLLAAITLPIMTAGLLRSKQAALAADGKILYGSFIKYNIDNGTFPSTSSPPARAFSLTTLAPLSNNGYYGQSVGLTMKLQNSRVTAYDSPNVGGSDSEFYAVLTLKSNPSIVVLVASTSNYPGHIGTWYDGVYYIQGANIVAVGS